MQSKWVTSNAKPPPSNGNSQWVERQNRDKRTFVSYIQDKNWMAKMCKELTQLTSRKPIYCDSKHSQVAKLRDPGG